MKLRLTFTVEIDEDGLAAYYDGYPAFKDENETAAATLIREAIAAWEWERLIHDAVTFEVEHDDECITLCPRGKKKCRIGHNCWCTGVPV